ncbi:MAG: D-sedoheptulose 7-phosphate isomerase [candidate division NC10 bacterium]|nr:D-sedoheptulose 7-phosphate isomerase [candidate division NC10 bacterium]
MKSLVEQLLAESVAVKQDLIRYQLDSVVKAADLTLQTLRRGNQLLLCGNGGSAADAQHLAAEFVNRFLYDRPALPAIALTTDTSILTAIGNDLDFSQIFARQVEALGKAGDLLYAISTSGNSPNVIRAVETARKRGIETVAFTGGDGGRLAPLCDHALIVPSRSTPRIQEVHITLGHIICQIVERELFPERSPSSR